jgi:hypothetical protein
MGSGMGIPPESLVKVDNRPDPAGMIRGEPWKVCLADPA